MSRANGGDFDKMPEFIESMYNVFKMMNKKAENPNDKRLKMISLVIFNYVKKMAKEHNAKVAKKEKTATKKSIKNYVKK